MENDDIFAKIKFLLFSWVPPSKISFRPLCALSKRELSHVPVEEQEIITPLSRSAWVIVIRKK